MALRRPISWGALPYRHQHDVHDADAADEEGDTRDRSQHQRQRPSDCGSNIQQGILTADVEVILGPNIVTQAQQVGDLKFGGGHAFAIAGRHRDKRHLNAVGRLLLPRQTTGQGGEGYHHGIVVVKAQV